MTSLTNLFFGITSGSVVVVTIVLVVALVYVIRILRNISDVSDRVREESELIQDDIHAVRAQAYKAGVLAAIVGFIRRLYRRKKK